MPRAVPILPGFSGGEITPLLFGRVDLRKYGIACREIFNMIPLAQGAATRRPGFRYIATARNGSQGRLIPFEAGAAQAYIIEATDLAFRFFANGGRVESPPGTPVEVATPYQAADLAALRWAQSIDVLYLAHPSHAPRKLSRTGPSAFTISTIAFQDGPFLPLNTTATTMTSGATSGATTLTASVATFAASDVGRQVRFESGGSNGWGTITGFTSSTSVNWTITKTLPSAGPLATWRLGAWWPGNYPGTVTFFSGRLWWGGSPSAPQTLWASRSGDFETMSPGAAADDGLVLTLDDDQMNAIRWLSGGRVLLVGTAQGEFVVQASNLNEAITPSNATARKHGDTGAAAVAPVRLGASLLFVQRAGKKLHEMRYDGASDTYLSEDISILAEHLTRRGLAALDWQSEPWRTVWMAGGDGSLIGLTYMRDQEVFAWHQHAIAGTGAKVLSVASIPGSGLDELWAFTERTVNGAPLRAIERMDPQWRGAAISEAYFVDCGLSYAGPATATVSGLAHLEGQTVSALVDGATVPDAVVTGGAVTLATAGARIHVGLGYASRLETLDLEAGAADGTAQTRRKRISEVGIRYFETVGGMVGWRDGSTYVLAEPPFRTPPMAMDQAVQPFTGDKVVTVPARWAREAGIVIRQDQPLPITIVAVAPRMTVND